LHAVKHAIAAHGTIEASSGFGNGRFPVEAGQDFHKGLRSFFRFDRRHCLTIPLFDELRQLFVGNFHHFQIRFLFGFQPPQIPMDGQGSLLADCDRLGHRAASCNRIATAKYAGEVGG